MSTTASAQAPTPGIGLSEAAGGDRLPAVILVTLGALTAAVLLYAGRDTLIFFDDWAFFDNRRAWNADAFLVPHNEHLSALHVLVYKVLFELVGGAPYWPYRVAAVMAHLTCVGLIYCIARHRLSGWWALGLSAVLLLLGSGWQVLVWPFGLNSTLALATGLGAWLALQVDSPGRRAGACALIVASLASSGVGAPIVLGILVRFLLEPGQRRHAWVALAPLAGLGIWYLGYGRSRSSQFDLSNLPDIPPYVADMGAAAIAGVTGLDGQWAHITLALLTGLVVWRLLRHGLQPWLVGGLVVLLSFWVLTALSRVDLGSPESSRYVYTSVVAMLLVCIELPPGTGWPFRRSRWTVPALVAGGLAIAVSGLVSNATELRKGGNSLRSAAARITPALVATELGGDAMAPDFRPEPQYAPNLLAGEYLEAIEDLGSPLSKPPVEVLGGRRGRATVDRTLAAGEGLTPKPSRAQPAAASEPPVQVLAIMGRSGRSGSCLRFAPVAIRSALDVRLPTGASLVVRASSRAEAAVSVRRFAPMFSQPPVGTVPAGAARSLSAPRDNSSRPWVMRVFSRAPVEVCAT